MKIRIAIIEDEFFARQAIKKYISRLGEPYEVCGEAGDGREGLEILRREKPDIALVDITMPVMNGIDMMQHAFDEGLRTQMIILTGYSDFSYARAAVHLGVREYLLKPLKIEDLKQTLNHVSRLLNREEKSRIPEGIDVDNLLSRQLAEQLTRSGTDSQDTNLLIEHLDFPRDTGVYYVTLIQFHKDGTEDRKIMSVLSAAALTALREKGFAAVGYPVEIHSLCLVVNIENSNAFDAMKETFVALANEIYKQLDVQLKVSLSSGCRKLDMVHDAYLEAHAVQQYHLFYGAKQVAFYTSENLVSGPGALFDAETRHTLMMLLRKHDERAIRKFIDDQLDSIQQRKTGPDTIYLCAAEMMSAIFEYISARFGDTGEGIAPENSYSSLLSLNHVDAIRKFVQDRAWDAMNQSNNDENAHGALIRRVHEYIDGNFSNSAMRLDDVARANFISTQYLCSVYRRATRFTIGDYIFEVRMRHAMKLINEGQRNVTSISESCGYDDPGYFCKCFRKKYGMTPRQYIESQNT